MAIRINAEQFSPNIWPKQKSEENSLEKGRVDSSIYSMTTRLVDHGAITLEQAVKVEKNSIGKFELRVELLRALGITVWFPDPIGGSITERTEVILKFKPQSKLDKMPTKQGVKSIW